MDSLTRRILAPIAKDSRVPEDIRATIAGLIQKRRPGPARAMRTGATKAQDKAKRDSLRDYNRRWTYSMVDARVREERGGQCELGCNLPAAEHHHVVSGSGARIANERPDTVIGVCNGCHGRLHRNDIGALMVAFGWAASHQFHRAAGAIDRRIAKAKRTAEYLDRNKERAS